MVAVQQEKVQREKIITPTNESLLKLVTPELSSLIIGWLGVLHDHALLSLPVEFSEQWTMNSKSLCFGSSNKLDFDSLDRVRVYYTDTWPTVLLSTANWLATNNFEVPELAEESDGSDKNMREKMKHFRMVMGKNIEYTSLFAIRLHIFVGISTTYFVFQTKNYFI